MKKRRILVGGLIVAASLLGGTGPAVADHDGRYGDCDWSGDCGDDSYRNEYGRGKSGDQGSAGRDQCRSFCNNVIIIPDPTNKGDGGEKGKEG